MSKKRDSSEGMAVLMAIAIGVSIAIFLLPFLIYSFWHRRTVLNGLRLSPTARNIFDAGNIRWAVGKYFLMLCAAVAILVLGLFILGAMTEHDRALGKVFAAIVIVISAVAFLAIGVAAGIATGVAMVGVWIDPGMNRLVFPADGVSQSFNDLITFRWVFGGVVMASVPLTDIASMTRESGNTVLLQGDFGSHRIAFSSKLKRDDCFNAVKVGVSRVGTSTQVKWW